MAFNFASSTGQVRRFWNHRLHSNGLLIFGRLSALLSSSAVIDKLPVVIPRIAVAKKPVVAIHTNRRSAHSYCRSQLKLAMVNSIAVENHSEGVTNGIEKNESNPADSTTWQEVEIPVPWGHLAAKVWGNPENGNPILTLHGWQDNAGSFDRLIPLLPPNVYIVCLDFTGHGRSSHYPPGMIYHYWDHLVHVKLVARHFGWKRFSILGHSLGGIVGSMFAAINPDMVEKLVLIDIVKPISVPPKFQPEKTAKAIESYEQILMKLSQAPPSYTYEAARDRLVQANGGSIDALSAEVLMRRGTRKDANGGIYFSRDLRHVIPSLANYSIEQHAEFAKRIRCPMLLIKAKNGPMYEGKEIHDQFLQIYRDNNPLFEYAEVDGTHHVHLVRPEAVAPLVEQFLIPSPTVDA